MAKVGHPREVGGEFLLQPGRNAWRVERAGRAALIVDAADYFRLARQAMLRARSRILILGWDFDTRIALIHDDEGDEAPAHLGPFLQWLSKMRPDLRIHILAWGGEAYSLLGRGTTLLRMAQWRLSYPRIEFRLDTNHPLEASHHQKVLVVDDSLAFCGGIDMTGSRWDTRTHRDDEPGRRRPTTRRPYPPWHDATMAADGDVARALGDLCRWRWKNACDRDIDCVEGECDPWPDALEPDFRDVEIAIARTIGRNGANDEVREVEALFVGMIEAAERFVYVENQYFASRVIAEAIARRLAEPDPPEFVLVNPRTGEGWLDETVMGAARAELFRKLREADRKDRFRLYYPVTEEGADIYVHAKVMIVDDLMLRVGSANMNNRSMGLDSECDVLIDARREANRGARIEIAAWRNDLMAEHLGLEPADVARTFEETGSLIETVERLRGPRRSLRPYRPPDVGEFAAAVAESEVADPESTDQPFEPITRRRLLRW
jgi:phospholipase D1/2